MSDITRKCKRLSILFTILHLLSMVGPLLYFIPMGYLRGQTSQKLTLSMGIVISLVLLMISIVMDIKHRAGLHKAIMWILIAVIIVCLNDIKVFVWIMAITSIIDELVFIKLKEHYKLKYKTNKEIDKRLPNA